MSLLTTRETAKLLGVSDATVRNWNRAGHLVAANARPLRFDSTHVTALFRSIRNNRFKRLRQRANKYASDAQRPEAAGDGRYAADSRELLRLQNEFQLNQNDLLFGAALAWLAHTDEVTLPMGEITRQRLLRRPWKRPVVKTVVMAWHKAVSGPISASMVQEFRPILDWDHADRLGLLYQACITAGDKARAGAFLTPMPVIDDVLRDMPEKTQHTFFDPCCGTGRYLMRAATRFSLGLDALYGFDIDPISVAIAKLNLLLQDRNHTEMPHIYCRDALAEETGLNPLPWRGSKIDIIATNPPWGGAVVETNRDRNSNPTRAPESFSLFLEKALGLVRPGGRLSFILPESFLKIKTHRAVRRLVLERSCVTKVELLGRIFPNVFTSIIRLDVIKKQAPDRWQVPVVINKRLSHAAPQDRFLHNPSCAFDVAVSPQDAELLEKIYSTDHVTLKHNAEWALGIVTGNNATMVFTTPRPGAEPVVCGPDISQYHISKPSRYVIFQPEFFQQVAPEEIYRAKEKLIYRFISDRLIFARDRKRLLTLNSANILIPRIPGLPTLAVLALLNSRLFQYIFMKKFQTRKVLRSDLEALPFPQFNFRTLALLVQMARRARGGQAREELERCIYRAFGLGQSDIRLLENSIKER